ncbi:4-hydroxyphenylacetate 3-hydroxylase C-terminal domain-containing protein [Candidatus Entotheonella palauensis]|uniref:4-hydroxyphenylacetate 3-hydroxylase C-terminal domain-containing protein n=1 Tax=Candidatus Entotheonella palauensis TaxID=93172 RepID=UPI000B7D4A2F|nr:4-hydroxyphenylacetate 3-hydroxylase C-terminal domain-containing protein [Candidatus Entotheonella palauensis]
MQRERYRPGVFRRRAASGPQAACLGHGLQTHTRLLEITRHLCSTSLIIAPSEVEFNHLEIGPLLNHYIAGEDPRAHERFKLSKLAWEYLGDSFAGRQLLFEEHSAGNLSRRQQLMDNYDPNPVIGLGKKLAGIDIARQAD